MARAQGSGTYSTSSSAGVAAVLLRLAGMEAGTSALVRVLPVLVDLVERVE